MNIEKIKTIISSSKIISFDLFDTLFYRPYLDPHDLFLHLEIIHNRPLFKEKRIMAEKNARFLSAEEEITHDEIYHHIDENLKDMKEKELSLELDSLMINKEIKELYDYAKSQRKELIFISDMYLSVEFISKLLNKFEIKKYTALYVSSDVKLTKHKGTMFQKVLNDFKCNPKNILHIGDNRRSDFINPKKLGIKAIHYPSLNDFFSNASFINKLQFEINEKEDSDFLQRLFFKRKINKHFTDPKEISYEKYWVNIGYYFGSLIALSYYNLILKHFNPDKDELIFIGRDGYSLKLFFDQLKPQWKSHYISLSRILVEQCNSLINFNEDNNINFLYEFLSKNEKKKYIKNKKEAVLNNLDYLKSRLKNNRKLFIQYLINNNVNLDKRFIIVDSATNNFTIQRFLSSITKDKVLGIYFYTRGNIKHNFNYEAVSDLGFNTSVQEGEAHFIQFVEYILSAPHELAVGIDPQTLNLIYRQENGFNNQRIENKALIDHGIKKGAALIKSVILDNEYKVSSETLIKNLNLFIRCPRKEDAYYFEKIKMTLDYRHKDHMPFLSSDYSFLKIIFSSKNKLKQFKRINYFNKYQILAMAIRYPIIIKSSSKKKFLKIFLLPYINFQIVNLSVDLFGITKLDLNIGKSISIENY